jgi:glutamate dehydrogenase
VVEHLPRVLIEFAGERLWERLPVSYMRWLMAKSLAARIVYKEGLDFLEDMPMAAIADTSVRYLRQERETRSLKEEVVNSQLPHRERIAALLDRGGTRAGL